jgi:hypothetical protein
MQHPILCTHYSNCQTAVSPCLHLLHHPKQKPPYVLKWFNWPKFKFRETPQAEFNFLQSQTSLAALIQVSRPQTGTSTQKHWVAKCLSTWQLMDVLPRLKLLSALMALTHSWCFPQLCYWQPKGIYLKEAPSTLRVWTWIAGPFQDLNPKGQ